MEHLIDNYNISNLTQAKAFLQKYNNPLLLNIETYLDHLFLNEELWINLSCVEIDVKNQLREIYNDYNVKSENADFTFSIKISLECIFFTKLHDLLIPLTYHVYKKEDEYFFNKSTELSNQNISAEQLGAHENYAVPLLAAVVELSSLDKYKSPLEKICCLCNTYDLIFAELKTVLIDIISRFSTNESEIPVIDNSDIIPILATVIIKSKLVHLFSNLYYIESFIGCLEEKLNIRHVLNSFKEAIEKIQCTTEESLMPTSDKVCRDLDLIKLIQITSEINTKKTEPQNNVTPLDTQMLKITDLLVISTNENNIYHNLGK